MGGKLNVHTPGITGVTVVITDAYGNGLINQRMDGSSYTWDLGHYDDGWYTVTVKKTGYEVESENYHVYGGGTTQAEFYLEEETPFYDIKVTYSPADATVTVKDRSGRSWPSK